MYDQEYTNLPFENIFTSKHTSFKANSIVFQKNVRNERQTYVAVSKEL